MRIIRKTLEGALYLALSLAVIALSTIGFGWVLSHVTVGLVTIGVSPAWATVIMISLMGYIFYLVNR